MPILTKKAKRYGRTDDPDYRIASLLEKGNSMGVNIISYIIYMCVPAI